MAPVKIARDHAILFKLLSPHPRRSTYDFRVIERFSFSASFRNDSRTVSELMTSGLSDEEDEIHEARSFLFFWRAGPLLPHVLREKLRVTGQGTPPGGRVQ